MFLHLECGCNKPEGKNDSRTKKCRNNIRWVNQNKREKALLLASAYIFKKQFFNKIQVNWASFN